MKWLITGGSGLIGKNLVRMLDEQYPAVVIDLKEKPQNISIRSTITWLTGDVTDKVYLESIIDEYSINGIVHFVSLLRGECAKDPVKCININVNSLLNILDIAVKKKIKKIVFMSSVQVYGAELDYGLETWVDEDTYASPKVYMALQRLIVKILPIIIKRLLT
jgi:UDP-glucose 4-epimerase